MTRINSALLACVLACGLAAPLYAQDPDPAANARFHMGPVWFSPALTFVGPGVDTNVFNEVEDPKRDMTMKVAPLADWWLRLGRGLVSASTEVDYQYFATYASQRSFNTNDNGRFQLMLGRIRPFVAGSYVNTRERPNYEIAVRARRTENSVGLGSEFQLFSKTTIIAAATRSRLRYDRNDSFYGTSLSQALDRRTDAVTFDVRHRLTSLTTFVVRADNQRDRFDYSKYRDADSVRVTPGFEFKPFALISGKAYVGYRSFRPLDPRVPDYKGLVASLDLAYVLSATRFTARVARDVAYSFEPTQPYYVLNDLTFGVTQMITRAVDVGATLGHQNLAYQSMTIVTPPGAASPALTNAARGREDTAFHGGFGGGYWVGRTLRVGVDVDYYTRHSPVYTNRDYESWQAGVSVKYGLKP